MAQPLFSIPTSNPAAAPTPTAAPQDIAPAAPMVAPPDTRPAAAVTELDVAQGATQASEPEAFKALHMLRENRRNPGMLSPEKESTLRGQLQSYVEVQRAHNRPLFPEQATVHRAAQVKRATAMLGGLDKLSEALPADKFAELESRAKLSPDPDGYRARVVNRNFLDLAYGKKVLPEHYEKARDYYAKKVLKIEGPLDDKGFYAALQARQQKQRATDEHLTRSLEDVFARVAAGESPDVKPLLADLRKTMPDIDESVAESYEDELRLARRQYRELRRQVEPLADALSAFVMRRANRADAIPSGGFGTETPEPKAEWEAAQRFNALSPEQQAMVGAIIEKRIESMPEDQRGVLNRAFTGASQTVERLGQGTADWIAGQVKALGQWTKEEDRRGFVDAVRRGDVKTAFFGSQDPRSADEKRAGLRLRNLSSMAGRVVKPTDNWFVRSGVLFSEQLPYLVAASTGAGTLLLATSMAGNSYSDALLNRPDADPAKQLGMATLSGAAQATIERASFGFMRNIYRGNSNFLKFLTGKYGTASVLNLAKVTDKFARAAVGGAVGVAGITAVEYGEEIAQDVTDAALQDLATELSGLDSTTDYGALLSSWDPRGEKGRDTVLALLPLALIGGAGASVRHFKHGGWLMKKREALEAVGVSPEKAREIAMEPDLSTAESMFKQEFDQNLDQMQRKAAADAFAEYLQGARELARAAGYELIEEDQGFTDDQPSRWLLRLPNEQFSYHASQEEAEQALLEAQRTEIEAAQDAAVEALTVSMVDFLKEEGRTGQDVQVNEQEFAGTFDELIRRGMATMEQVQKRLEIYAMEQGRSLESVQADVRSGRLNLRIMARAYSQELVNGSKKYFVDLFQGADPLNAAEDFAENHWSMLLDNQLIDAPTVIGWLRATEYATGNTYLDAGITPQSYRHADHRMNLIEALSKASIQYLMAESRSDQLPEGFRGWIEQMVLALGKAWNWAKELLKSQKLRQAIEDGQIPQRFVDELADSVGLNDRAREQRGIKQMQEQAMAEMLAEFPKLSDRIKGKLMHPETARQENSPFAGELRRIYDHFVSTKRVRKWNKKGQLSESTRENVRTANAFFAPAGTYVDLDRLRESLAEDGFPGMETVSDMLRMVEEVVAIDKVEYYATHGGMLASSFSLGRAVPTNANAPIVQAQNATIIGPTTFSMAAEAYGYPHRPNEEGPRAFDLTESNIMPDDVYDHPEWYSAMDAKIIRETIAQLRKIKGKPEADVTIYRAGPVPAINQGDWVSLSKEYARTHADSQDPEGYKVWKATVKAKDVRWDMNDLAEFGYFGENTAAEDSGITFSITAFHGTPHKVDRFTTAKIGTGEGAQAYGWGLYFAENRNVAASYKQLHPEFKKIRDTTFTTDPTGWVAGQLNNNIPEADILDGIGILDENLSQEARQSLLDEGKRRLEQVNQSANLYTVTLKVEDDQLLDWDKPLSEQPEVLRMLSKTDWWQYAEDVLDRGTENPTGNKLHRYLSEDSESDEVSNTLLAAGIRGIRYLDGNSRNEGEGTYNYVIFDENDIEITEENGQPITLADASNPSNPSFSLSAVTGSPIATLLEQKATQGPQERATIMEGIRTRLQAVQYKREARESGMMSVMERQLQGWRARTDLTPEQRERLRIEDAMAEIKAVLNAVPAEIRGKITVPMNRILDADTEKTTSNAFAELIENLDDVLEQQLRADYTEAISNILDIAQPTISETRQQKGKLIVETNKLIKRITEIQDMAAIVLAAELSTSETRIAELEQALSEADESNEAAVQQIQTLLEDAQNDQMLLYHFGNLGSKDARELAQSLKILREIYTRGRYARQILDDERRQWLRRMRTDVKMSLDAPRGVSGPTHAARTEKKQMAKGYALNLMSIHNLLASLFPYSQFAADLSERLISAQRATTRARLNAKDRFEAFLDTRFGTKNRRERNRIIRALHVRKYGWPQVAEVDGPPKTEKLTIEQAQKILSGEMKPGWEQERDTMILLQQAYRDWRAKPARARNATKFVEITRVTSRKKPEGLYLSDMDALYLLQLSKQEEYLPALATHGYTEEVMAEIRRLIDPRALALGEFYAAEYEANWADMNPVFQRLYHMDMPQIRNYAPGMFENMKDENNVSGDPMGDGKGMSALSFGSTKNRRAHRSRPKQYSAHAVWMAHVDRSTYWVNFAELARDMSMVLRETEVRRAIEARHGMEASAEIKAWIENINNDGAVDAAARLAANTVGQNIAAGQAIAGLAFNLGVPFKQFSAALGSIFKIGPNAAMRAFARAIFRPESFGYVWKSEAIQQRIREGFSPEDRAMLDAAEVNPEILWNLHTYSRLPTSYADALFTTISGVIAYDHHYQESIRGGMSEKQAHELAMQFMDRAIFLTSQPADTQTKSNWEVQLKGLGKLFSLYRSDPRKQIGHLIEAYQLTKQGRMSKAEFSSMVATQWAIYGMLSYVGGSMFRALAHDDDDDRPIWDWKELLVAMLIGPVEGAGFIGSVVQAGIKLFSGSKTYGDSMNPVAENLKRSVSRLKDFDPLDLGDYAALASTLAQVGSMRFPLAGLVPAAMRGAGQVQNMLDNLHESESERLSRLNREFAKAATEAAKMEARRVDDFATSDTPLDQVPEEIRAKVARARAKTTITQDGAPEIIQDLRRATEKGRRERIRYMLEYLPEAERESFRALLRQYGMPDQ